MVLRTLHYKKTNTSPQWGLDLLRVDKLASSTVNLHLDSEVSLGDPKTPKAGDVVAVRVLSDNASYNQLELTNGRLARIKLHDILVGVLGRRRALKGFVGEIPETLAVGDRLHILNLGGLIGRCVGHYHGLGNPIEVELLGSVMRDGAVLNIAEGATPTQTELKKSAPLVIVAGSCMNSGKTLAASSLIKHMTRKGYSVAGAKLSGVACLRDTLNMEDHGAFPTLSFLDCGFPSTVGLKDLAPMAKGVVTQLNESNPDVIVIELGDGLLGGYEVESIFQDDELMEFCGALVYCASDFVGAWGGIQLMRQLGREIHVVSGSTTDSKMGVEYIEREFGVSAANALNDGERLFSLVQERVDAWKPSK